MAYLAANRDERQRMEAILQIMVARDLDLGPGSDSIYLAAPPEELCGTGPFLIGSVSTPFVPHVYWIFESIIMNIVLTPITFFVLIYSYLILTSYFFKELAFDFESLK